MSRLTTQAALRALEDYRLRRNHSRTTIQTEAALLRALLPKLNNSLSRLTVDDVRAYLARRAEQVRPSTTARELSALRVLFRALGEAGLLHRDPTAGLPIPRTPPRPQVILSTDAVACLLVAASEPPRCRRSPEIRSALALRNRALLELLYGTGARASEICRLRVLDLDLGAASCLIQRAKRGPCGVLPLPPAAIPHLDAYLREGRPVLAKGEDAGFLLLTLRGRGLSPGHVHKLVWTLGRRVGVPAHPHAFRRSLATHLARAGVAVAHLRELLGHARLDTTQVYLGVNVDDLRAAVEKLERRGPGRSDRPGRSDP